MKTYTKISLGIATFCSLICLSCKDFLSIAPPANELTSETVFSDSTNASQALRGIYVYMVSESGLSFGAGGLTAYPGLSADELSMPSNEAVLEEFAANKISPLNNTNYILWTRAYEYIYRTNACIEGITGSRTIGETTKAHLLGEARFLRAFFYFNLVNLFENVPLILNTDYKFSSSATNATATEIYKQMEDDLLFAKSVLKTAALVIERPNYYAVTALLAKVYLYQGKYENAFTESDEIINSGRFHLEENITDVFTADSRETLWKLFNVLPNRETGEGFGFIPANGQTVPRFVVKEELYRAFSDTDLRKSWISEVLINGETYPFPYKYKNRIPGGAKKEDYVVFRLAEQYLIRAEAAAYLEDLSMAIADLNEIRSRAGLDKLPLDAGSQVVGYIVEERKKELFCEWGNRWFDLKRWGMLESVIGPTKPNWDESAIRYPIPQSELDANPFLKQNIGYN